MITARKQSTETLSHKKVGPCKTNRAKILLAAVYLAGTVSCSPERNTKRLVEYEARVYAYEVLKLPPGKYEISSIDRKEDYWLVVFSPDIRVPSGDVFLWVTDEGTVEDESTIMMKNYLKNIKGIR